MSNYENKIHWEGLEKIAKEIKNNNDIVTEEYCKKMSEEIQKKQKKEFNKKNYQFWFDNDMAARFDAFCSKVNITKTDGLQFLLEIAFDTYEKYELKKKK